MVTGHRPEYSRTPEVFNEAPGASGTSFAAITWKSGRGSALSVKAKEEPLNGLAFIDEATGRLSINTAIRLIPARGKEDTGL
jgi:hypothetical protein